MCNFVDQFSRFIVTTGPRRNSDGRTAFDASSNSYVTKWFRNGIIQFHTDGGGEHESNDVENLLHTNTTPDAPQHKPFAERISRTLLDPVRTILHESGLPHKYWVEACQHVANNFPAKQFDNDSSGGGDDENDYIQDCPDESDTNSENDEVIYIAYNHGSSL